MNLLLRAVVLLLVIAFSPIYLLGWLIGVPADALIRIVLQVTGQGG